MLTPGNTEGRTRHSSAATRVSSSSFAWNLDVDYEGSRRTTAMTTQGVAPQAGRVSGGGGGEGGKPRAPAPGVGGWREDTGCRLQSNRREAGYPL